MIPPAPPGQMRPHAGRKAGEKGQAPKKRPGAKDRLPGSRLLLFRPRRRGKCGHTPGQMRPHAGANAATRRAKSGRKRASPEKAPRCQRPAARKPPSYSLRPRRRALPIFLCPVRRGRAGRVGERGTAVAPTKHLGKIQGIPIAAERRAFGHRTPLPQ